MGGGREGREASEGNSSLSVTRGIATPQKETIGPTGGNKREMSYVPLSGLGSSVRMCKARCSVHISLRWTRLSTRRASSSLGCIGHGASLPGFCCYRCHCCCCHRKTFTVEQA